MKIYIEFVYIINFLLDFMILYGTKRLLKINKSIIRIVFSSSIGMLTTIFLYTNISGLELFFIKIIFSVMMIIVAFGFNNIFKNIFYFYLLSIILGGMIYLFDFKISFYFNCVFLVVGCLFILFIIVKELMNYRIHISDKYNVSITYNKKTYLTLRGFTYVTNTHHSIHGKNELRRSLPYSDSGTGW